MHPGQVRVADPQALAAQQKVIDAQKEFAAIQFAQNIRIEKAKNAINFILLPLTQKDGVVRQEPEYDDAEMRPHVVKARAAAYDFIAHFFSTTTDFEAGIPITEEPTSSFGIATA